MRPARLHVYIDALALPSHAAGSRVRIATAFERELQRLLRGSVGQLSFIPRSITKLDAGSLHIPARTSGHDIGREMASKIFARVADRA